MSPSALQIVDRLLTDHQHKKLTDIQSDLVAQVLEGASYPDIATTLGYEPQYIKTTAAKLWQLLSTIVGTKVSKSNLGSILQDYAAPLNRADWGDAIDLPAFYGRQDELAILTDWVTDHNCRMIGIFGWGGIGKTALSVELAHQLEPLFECVIWRSLRQAPTLSDLLHDIIPILAGSTVQEISVPAFMEQLRQKRCLLVFDNVESILQQGDRGGCYLPGYEVYGQLSERVSDEDHQSCVVLTSREKPHGLALREGPNLPVRCLPLTGLSIAAAQNILTDKGIDLPPSEQSHLIEMVDGNPLALKLLVTSLRESFNNDIRALLAQDAAVFRNLWGLLSQQFDRLSPLQQHIMFWLAINREGATPGKLQAELIPTVILPTVLEALTVLRDHSLIETIGKGLNQQPVVMEYVTDRFLQEITQEIIAGKLCLLVTHLLIEAQTQDYLREAQIQLILQPLIDRLLDHFVTLAVLEKQLQNILDSLRHQTAKTTGYAAGNLINLLRHLKSELTGLNFSDLAIRQAYLSKTLLHHVDFTGSQIHQTVFTETFGGVVGMAYSHDGQFLATSDTKGDIQIWNTHSYQQVACCRGHKHWVWSIAFSPDGQYLASASDDYVIKLWDVETGECLQNYTGHSCCVNAIAFSPDGETMASGAQDSTVRLWRVFPEQSPAEIFSLTGHQGRVWSVAFSPDGQTLASVAEDCTIRLWEVATGQELKSWIAHSAWIRSVAFSPNGHQLATGSHDLTVKIWDIGTQYCLQTCKGHQQPIVSVAYSPDGQTLMSSSFDRSVRIWDIPSGECSRTLLGHQSRIWSAVFHPNGQQVASGSDDNTAKIWDIQSGRCIQSINGHTNVVLAVALSPNGRYLASGHEDQTVRLRDFQTGEVIQMLREHTNRVWSVMFSPEGDRLLTASADYTLKLWDWRKGVCEQTLKGHTSWVFKAIFNPLGTQIASCSYDRTICIWDVQTGECLHQITGVQVSIVSVAFSPNGQLLASSDADGGIQLWDVETGVAHPVKIAGHPDGCWSIKFSPDGQWLLSSSIDRTLKLWSVATGECLKTFTGHLGPVLIGQFSPDGQWVVSGGFDRSLRVWNIATGDSVQTLTGHSGLIYHLDVAEVQRSSDQPTLLAFSGSLDETIRVWDLEAATCLATWKSLRPYEGMKIRDIQGLTTAQKDNLEVLGAIP
jgi:WD40 repeat protein